MYINNSLKGKIRGKVTDRVHVERYVCKCMYCTGMNVCKHLRVFTLELAHRSILVPSPSFTHCGYGGNDSRWSGEGRGTRGQLSALDMDTVYRVGWEYSGR